jgi:hypothetical protein
MFYNKKDKVYLLQEAPQTFAEYNISTVTD